jgi:hypothetical protein
MKATRPGTVGTLAKVGMLAKVVNQRARPITAGTPLTSRMTIRTPLISTAAWPPESAVGKSAKVEKPATAAGSHNWNISNSLVDCSRENRDITYVNSRRDTLNGRDASNSRDNYNRTHQKGL